MIAAHAQSHRPQFAQLISRAYVQQRRWMVENVRAPVAPGDSAGLALSAGTLDVPKQIETINHSARVRIIRRENQRLWHWARRSNGVLGWAQAFR